MDRLADTIFALLPWAIVALIVCLFVLRARARDRAVPLVDPGHQGLIFRHHALTRAGVVAVVVLLAAFFFRRLPEAADPTGLVVFCLLVLLPTLWLARDFFFLRAELDERGVRVERFLRRPRSMLWRDLASVAAPVAQYRVLLIAADGRRVVLPIATPGLRRILVECGRRLPWQAKPNLDFHVRTLLGIDPMERNCPRCGYPAGASPVCSECGLPLIGVTTPPDGSAPQAEPVQEPVLPSPRA